MTATLAAMLTIGCQGEAAPQTERVSPEAEAQGASPATPRAEESAESLIERVRAIDPQPNERFSRIRVFSVSQADADLMRGLCGGVWATPLEDHMARAMWSPGGGEAHRFGCAGYMGDPRTHVYLSIDDENWVPGNPTRLSIRILDLRRERVERAVREVGERFDVDRAPCGPEEIANMPGGYIHCRGIEPSLTDQGWSEAVLTVSEPPTRLARVVLR